MIELFYYIIILLLFSLAIDVSFGELPTKIHPVVIMGSVITFYKNKFIKIKGKISGMLLVIFSVMTVSLILYILYLILSFNDLLLFILFILLLTSSFSVKMLLKTAIDVKNDLNESIEKARKSVSYLVSRNTDELTESFIVSAAVESLSENITDSYVAPVFYYMVIAILMMIFPLNIDLFYLILVPYTDCSTLLMQWSVTKQKNWLT